ncbi:MAG: alpha/beta hydrolase [Chitinophagales bacterium]|nr:alpha/beta hydrolase [Chitinophagales bacterium]
MKIIFRRKRIWLIIVLILLATPLIFFYVMMSQFSWSQKEIDEYFKTKKMKPVFATYTLNGRTIFYSSIGSDTLPMVLFVHGAPGSWTDYIKYFGDENLISKSHLVAPDRPGYGNSGVGYPVTSIEEQVELLKPLFALNKSHQPIILLGHSYGGPIAARMAIDYPDQIKAMILLAPAIDPDNEKMFWINKPASWKAMQYFLPAIMLTAQKEKETHAAELKKMENDWGKIAASTIYMYGDKDGLVPPVNVEYAKKKITNAPLEVIELPNENHFIPWTQQDSVTRVILRYIEK